MSLTTIEELTAMFHRVAQELGLPVHELTRDKWRKSSIHCPEKRIRKAGGFSAVKALACPPVPMVPEGHEMAGVSSYRGKDGKISQWIKTRKVHENREEILRRLLQEIPLEVPSRETPLEPPPGPLPGDLLAVYPMGDPHVGMLSWAPETGEDFDLKIATRVMESAFRELAQRAPWTATALLINLGDFFHSDTFDNRTARAGHALDVDGRWPKVLRVGIGLMVYAIDQLLEFHENVRVINEIGNHDDHTAIVLSVALDAYYRNEPRVAIDMSPAAFHWFRFGRNLIGTTHGHRAKGRDLEAIMAADRAQDWGETAHRVWYCGHIHHKTVQEHRGCTVETFRTLAAKDAWHAAQGYRSNRDMNRIVLHHEFGEIERATVSAEYLAARYKREA